MKVLNYLLPLALLGLLSGCVLQNKFASSFGKRKYTKGFYWDPAAAKTSAINACQNNPKPKTDNVSCPSLLRTSSVNRNALALTGGTTQSVIVQPSIPLTKVQPKEAMSANMGSFQTQVFPSKCIESKLPTDTSNHTTAIVLARILFVASMTGLFIFLLATIALITGMVFASITNTVLILGGLGLFVVCGLAALLVVASGSVS